MKILLIIVLLFLILSACKDETVSSNCNSENPLKMEWLANWVGELQQCPCTISIFQAEYKGQTVFWSLMNDPLCQSIIENITIYNCSGEEILILNNYEELSAFNKQVTELRIIYVCSKN